MSAWFITAIVLAALAGLATIIRQMLRRSSEYSDLAKPATWIARGFVAIAAVSLIASCFAVVSTKNVGIVTAFGRPIDTLSNGLHAKAPWTKVSELDGSIQTDTYTNNEKEDVTPCITVRIAHQAFACIDNSVRWRIRQERGDTLFRDYRTFDNIRDSLVRRELGATLGTVFQGYDPLATDDSGNSIAPSNDALSEQATKALADKVGTDIEVLNVIVTFVHLDPDAQKRLNLLQAEVANTRIAQQREATATADANANRQLASSVSNDPNVLVSKCFDLVAQIYKDGHEIPPGFNCWQTGQSTPVLVNTPASK